MEEEDFASPVVELNGAKSVRSEPDVSLERNWRAAPIG
jgi:hypothetical protein